MRILLTITALSAVISFGQVKDANLWAGYGLKMEMTKKFSVELESQARFSNNASSFNQFYTELSAGYKIIKPISVGFTYRYSRKNAGDYYFNQNRFCLDLSLKHTLDMGLGFKTRARYQHVFDRLKTVNFIYPDKANLYRQSFKISYKHPDFKLLTPYIGAELFYALQPVNPTSKLDTYRFKAGVVVDLPKRLSLKVFYTYEYENRTEDNINHIYGLQVNYSFKSLKKLMKGSSKSDSKSDKPEN